jgi:hypothetical protein
MGAVLFIQPLIALIAGIAILIAPRLLNYIVAGFLILFGLFGLFPHLFGMGMMAGGMIGQ